MNLSLQEKSTIDLFYLHDSYIVCAVKIITTLEELANTRSKVTGLVALVPTMGALHAGHLQLIKDAREAVGEEGTVIVSIYVNPTQFDRTEDLEKYPKTLTHDTVACQKAGVDYLFTPTSLYFKDSSITVTEDSVSKHLCGKSRPGHFNGVCTVVLKLYNLTRPDIMVFGAKDFQQVAVIQRMTRDLHLPVTLHISPTVREPSGLAMSSRNQRLSPNALAEAPTIFKTLKQIKQNLQSRNLTLSEIESAFTEGVAECQTPSSIDYISLINAHTLEKVNEDFKGQAILAIAVFFDGIRLIDHISVDLN